MFHKKKQTTLNRHSQNWSWQQTFLRQAYSPWTLGMTWEPCLPDPRALPVAAAAGQWISTSLLLPLPLDSARINSFHHHYHALGAYLQTFMDKYWYKLLGEWRKVLGSWILPLKAFEKEKSTACVQPPEEPALQHAVQQCYTGMHKPPLCWPSNAVQRKAQSITLTTSTVPQILVRDCRAWVSHTDPCSSGRSSQLRLQKGSLAWVTHRKERKIWIISDIWGHCSNNPSLLHLA